MSAARSFTSIIGSDIAAYVVLKKALGRGFAAETAILADLDGFLARRSCDLSAEVFAAWCLTLERLTPTVRRNWMRIARNLCLYRRRRDPACFVPDPTGFPAAHAPVPQACVSPTPRSNTRRRTWSGATISRNPTFTRRGKRA